MRNTCMHHMDGIRTRLSAESQMILRLPRTAVYETQRIDRRNTPKTELFPPHDGVMRPHPCCCAGFELDHCWKLRWQLCSITFAFFRPTTQDSDDKGPG